MLEIYNTGTEKQEYFTSRHFTALSYQKKLYIKILVKLYNIHFFSYFKKDKQDVSGIILQRGTVARTMSLQ